MQITKSVEDENGIWVLAHDAEAEIEKARREGYAAAFNDGKAYARGDERTIRADERERIFRILAGRGWGEALTDIIAIMNEPKSEKAAYEAAQGKMDRWFWSTYYPSEPKPLEKLPEELSSVYADKINALVDAVNEIRSKLWTK